MSEACPEFRVLIVDDGAPARWAPAIASLLATANEDRLTACGVCAADGPLVQTVVREAPQALLWLLGTPDATLPARLDALAQVAALPVLLWPVPEMAAPAEDWIAALAEREAALWWPAPEATDARAVAATLPLQLRWQVRRHALARARQEALDDARQRLDERKWVDRAKGMLMQHQQLSESDAFALLRTASQHANLRVGEISRGLLEAAQAAEAINRGGQLRMLSQRLVKACALQSGSGAAAGTTRSRTGLPVAAPSSSARNWDAPLIDDSVQRLQANLAHLAGLGALATVADVARELQRSQAAWQAVQAALEPAMVTGSAGELLVLDAQAEALLEAAEGLTAALERASGRRSLRLVNLCGRQRMLSQRLAKQALLASRCDGEAAALQAAAAVRTLGELERGLRTLEAAPLSTEDIRSALARALGQWQRLRQTLAAPAAAAGTGADATALLLARESEALLASFEHLTSLYEHSMQVLLG